MWTKLPESVSFFALESSFYWSSSFKKLEEETGNHFLCDYHFLVKSTKTACYFGCLVISLSLLNFGLRFIISLISQHLLSQLNPYRSSNARFYCYRWTQFLVSQSKHHFFQAHQFSNDFEI